MHLVDAGNELAVLAVDPSSTRTRWLDPRRQDADGAAVARGARRSSVRRRPAARSAAWPAARARRCSCARPPASTSCSSRPSASASPRSRSRAWSTCSCCCSRPVRGDELQGVKRGIVELADLVVVNKADGALLEAAARHTAADYAHALHLVRAGEGAVPVLAASALDRRRYRRGVGRDRRRARRRRARTRARSEPARAEQARDWMWSEVTRDAGGALPRRRRKCAPRWTRLEADVVAGRSLAGRGRGARDCSTAVSAERQLAPLRLASARLATRRRRLGLRRLMAWRRISRAWATPRPPDRAGALVERPIRTTGAGGEQAQLRRPLGRGRSGIARGRLRGRGAVFFVDFVDFVVVSPSSARS